MGLGTDLLKMLSSPSPHTCGCASNMVSSSVDPDRIMPTMNTGALLSEPTPAGQNPGWKIALMLSVCCTKLSPSNVLPFAANSTRCACSRYVQARSSNAAFSAAAYLFAATAAPGGAECEA